MRRIGRRGRRGLSEGLDAGHAPRVSPSWQDKPGVGPLERPADG
jgi:hypothetical protein